MIIPVVAAVFAANGLLAPRCQPTLILAARPIPLATYNQKSKIVLRHTGQLSHVRPGGRYFKSIYYVAQLFLVNSHLWR